MMVAKRSSKSTKSTDAIQHLLDERIQIVDWLDRLGSGSDNTPEHIREKVREDYQVRLDEILEKLREHSSKLHEALETQEEQRETLAAKVSSEEERLAEAELRHSVGEYDKEKWSEIRSEIRGALAKNKAKMKVAEKEIARLEEALVLMEGSEEAEEYEEEPLEELEAVDSYSEEDEPEEEEDVAPEDMVPEEEAAERGEPRLSSEQEAVDELAFLKSVTEDESHGPQASRATAGFLSPEAESDDPPSPDKAGSRTKARGRSSGEKTLKCEECGALNKPTEWYCERCGAELTSL
jgi:ElaB/YqjD/DUF883 family membrane-anchored ribosome-binding protein